MRYVLPTLDPATAQRHGIPHSLDVTSETTGLRIVFDQDGSGTEHDVLIERWPTGWALLVHAFGGDPVVILEILPDRLDTKDDMGRPLISIPISAPQQPTKSV